MLKQFQSTLRLFTGLRLFPRKRDNPSLFQTLEHQFKLGLLRIALYRAPTQMYCIHNKGTVLLLRAPYYAPAGEYRTTRFILLRQWYIPGIRNSTCSLPPLPTDRVLKTITSPTRKELFFIITFASYHIFSPQALLKVCYAKHAFCVNT
jgi:hypothetical protein